MMCSRPQGITLPCSLVTIVSGASSARRQHQIHIPSIVSDDE